MPPATASESRIYLSTDGIVYTYYDDQNDGLIRSMHVSPSKYNADDLFGGWIDSENEKLTVEEEDFDNVFN